MWRSSRSDRKARRRGPEGGFTLLEAMISLLLLVIVLIVAMTMLFEMRAFAERQQFYMLPRQTARRAADYLSFYFAGASDANYAKTASPNALIMYYTLNGALTKASYNNLTNEQSAAGYGDAGTDIITMVTPFDPARYQSFATSPAMVPGPNTDLYFNYRVGCSGCGPSPLPACTGLNDAADLDAFQAATGFDGTKSALLMLVDGTGNWSYARIKAYLGADCSDVSTFKNVHVTADTGGTSTVLPAPPNGAATLVDPIYLVTGLQVISFRVRTDPLDGLPKLQQKLGLFDPDADTLPGSEFTNVMENVEDLQVAYMYSQTAAAGAGGSLVWNTATQTIDLDCLGCNVPSQAGPTGASQPFDIINVIGARVSVTGRSPRLPLAAQKLTNVDVRGSLASTASQHFRPSSEDHPQTDPPQFDLFDHYRQTATLLLRNRIPRG